MTTRPSALVVVFVFILFVFVSRLSATAPARSAAAVVLALVLLFPKLQLWHGVLITSVDVLLFLAMSGTGKVFEYTIGGLVMGVMVCMCVILGRVEVEWGEAFVGFLPSRWIVPDGALYTCELLFCCS